MGLGLLITFGLCFGMAQAGSQMMQPNLPAATVFYVDANAGGEATGLDWTNAFTTVQDALASAASGDQVWVAEGVYYPDQGTGQANNMANSTFVLADGVALYGGFDPASADPWNDRDWVAHPTILSGDIDHETNPDGTDPRGVVTDTSVIQGNNAFHVVSSSGATRTAILDGFTITAGQADGNTSLNNNGGGMSNRESSPTLTNVAFSGNSASQDGGGMSNRESSPTLTNLTFFGNSADRYGGGMYNYDHSSPALTNVAFSGNSVAWYGGGVCNRESSSPALTNVTFSGNSANQGGGMSNSYSSNPTLANVIFSGNSASQGGGMFNVNSSSPTLNNTILWGNQADPGAQIFNGNNCTPLIRFSGIQDAFGGSGIWDLALGINGGGNIDADPIFEHNPNPGDDGNWDGIDDDYGDLHLRPGSPAIDKGTNDGCPATDLDGKPRPVNICDMGAYETGYILEISKTVDDATPQPGQTITFTIVVDNRSLDISSGLISDTLPAGLNFLGPISLETSKSGTAGSRPPTLASGLAISYTDRITVTFPVTVSYGLISGTQLINIAAVSASKAISPVLTSATISVQNAAPVAVGDGGTGFLTDKSTAFATTSVLTNDSDPNGDALTISSLDTTGTKGLVTDHGNGTFTYNPNGQFDALEADEQASDTFIYTVNDGHGGTDTATVTITILGAKVGFPIYLPLVMR